MLDRVELTMSPNFVRFAGVAQFLEYCAWQYKIAHESWMDDSAGRDLGTGMDYISVFRDSFFGEELEKYTPLINELEMLFLNEAKECKRIGTNPFPNGQPSLR